MMKFNWTKNLHERRSALLCHQCDICLQILEPLGIVMDTYISPLNREPEIKNNDTISFSTSSQLGIIKYLNLKSNKMNE